MTSIKKNVKNNAGIQQDSATQVSGCLKGEAFNLNKHLKMPLTDTEKENKKMIEGFISKYSKNKIKLSVDDYRKAKFEMSMINLFSILNNIKEQNSKTRLLMGDKDGKYTRRNAKGN